MTELELADYAEAKEILTSKVTALAEAGLEDAAVDVAALVLRMMKLKGAGQAPVEIFKKVWPMYPAKTGGFS